MNRAILSQRISSIQSSIQRLHSILFTMDTTDIQRYPDSYETLSIDAALRAEQIACWLRHLIFATTRARKEDYLPSAASMMGIVVERNGDVMELTLPAILPKRKRRPSTEYLLDPFVAALSQYAKEHPMPRYEHCVVCFSSIYSQKLPERRVRDYDNLEWKQLWTWPRLIYWWTTAGFCATPISPRSWAKRTVPASSSWTAVIFPHG